MAAAEQVAGTTTSAKTGVPVGPAAGTPVVSKLWRRGNGRLPRAGATRYADRLESRGLRRANDLGQLESGPTHFCRASPHFERTAYLLTVCLPSLLMDYPLATVDTLTTLDTTSSGHRAKDYSLMGTAPPPKSPKINPARHEASLSGRPLSRLSISVQFRVVFRRGERR